MTMTGPLMAASFSSGCEMANELGLTPLLEKYVLTEGKSCPEEKIREALKKLASYFYYLAIASSNGTSDPFDLQVVKAHWIGNGLLSKVTPKKSAFVLKKEMEKRKSEEVILLAYCLKPLILDGKAHHNFYAKHIGKEECGVTVNGKYLWHLGQERLLAGPDDLENLAKYGRT